MALRLSKTLRIQLIDPTSVAQGYGLFSGCWVSGVVLGLLKAGDKVRELRIEFGDIRNFGNYGELLVRVNDNLREQGLSGLIKASLGDSFTTIADGTHISGRNIVLETTTCAFCFTNSSNHNIVRWLSLARASQDTIHKELVLGAPVTEESLHPDPHDRYEGVSKHIILPLIFVSRASDTDEQVSETPRTAVIESADNSQRTALNVSRHVNYNPEGTLDSSGAIPREYERYVNNVLLGLSQRVLGQPEANVYVTNPMKRMDVIDFEPGYIRFRKDQLEQYIADTEQTNTKFKVAVVIETVYTVHCAYFELEVITDPEHNTTTDYDGNQVDYPYALARILVGTMPVTNREIIFSVAAFYPILTVYSSINVQFKETNTGPTYSFSCIINPSEDKRAVL